MVDLGVGTTHIAQALGHHAVRQGAHVRFTRPAGSSTNSPMRARRAVRRAGP
ncbi:ATP-binding protein [Streptomyces avermitilis]|uniref:ATP-binding protein n=1 Tax=Streptomyces avermitilis TaxID=33903 RepID=UPI001F5BD16A|nr:ATP-binding protein [Streptomyces avermitilis]